MCAGTDLTTEPPVVSNKFPPSNNRLSPLNLPRFASPNINDMCLADW